MVIQGMRECVYAGLLYTGLGVPVCARAVACRALWDASCAWFYLRVSQACSCELSQVLQRLRQTRPLRLLPL